MIVPSRSRKTAAGARSREGARTARASARLLTGSTLRRSIRTLSSAIRADHRRIAQPKLSPRLRALPPARSALDGMRAVGNAPPPTLACVSTTVHVDAGFPECRADVRRARIRVQPASREHRQHGNLRSARAGSRYKHERRLERGERELVDAQRARERILAQRGDHARAPTMIPACGPPSSLSPLIVTSVAPARTAFAGGGLARESDVVERHEQSAAEVVDERDVRARRR